MTARTILVADDDRGARRFVSDVLERDGWRVVAEKDGEGALRTFNRVTLDAVILDVLMPGMTGFQVAEALRKTDAGQELPVIFVSGVYRASLHRTDALRRYRALAFLEKPVVPEQLLEILREHFGPIYPRASRIFGQVMLTDPLMGGPPPARAGEGRDDREEDSDSLEAPPPRSEDVAELEALPEGALFDGPLTFADSAAVDDSFDAVMDRLGEATHPPAAPFAGAEGAPGEESAPADGGTPPDGPSGESLSHPEQREVELEASRLEAQARGDLSRRTFPRLLHQLHRERSTGALFLLREKIKKIVFFKEGQPIYVKSNLLNECLGKVLVRERMISEQECRESLSTMEQTGRLQGTILIEMGCISPQNLVYGLELQLQVKLYDIFSWTQGEYIFRDQLRLPSEVVTLGLSNAGIIYEGIRRKVTRERIAVELDESLSRYLRPSPSPELRHQPIDLGPEDQAFLNAISGRRTLRDHLEMGLLGLERAHKLCYALICAGIVELTERPSAPAFLDVRTMPAAVVTPVGPAPAATISPVPRASLGVPTPSAPETPGPRAAREESEPDAPDKATTADGPQTTPEPGPAADLEWSEEESRTDPSEFIPPELTEPPEPHTNGVAPTAGAAETHGAPPMTLDELGATGREPDVDPEIEPDLTPDPGPAAAPAAELYPEHPADREAELAPQPAAELAPEVAPDVDPDEDRGTGRSLLDRLEARRDRAASVEEWLATVVLCLRDASPTEVLGIEPTASQEDLARSYARLARRYDPDRTAPLDEGTTLHQRRRLLAVEIFEVISRAYQGLTDVPGRGPSTNQGSRATTMAPGRDALNQEVLRILSAERQFQLGESLLRERQYEEAVEAFRQAVELNAHEAEFRAYLGWALFQCAPQDEQLVAEAIFHLEEGKQINPRLDKPYLFLGYIYKALGHPRDAARLFEKVLEVNPECDEARRELWR